MSQPAIIAEKLSKFYLVGHNAAPQERYTALRDVLTREAGRVARGALDLVRGRQFVAGDVVEEFWALRDVSFEVGEGEILGIVGRNGAGKSTLLKILSRITEPTEGRAVLRGRVSILLEVGTGFHPELTGRENIFLNGATLGMTRAEIRRKFDEIVAFSEVERFLDTPVKRFSSGMYVRLAFAVAAHLEPEILLVDEVLAVGDAEFQKKCLGKMQDVASKQGRTVLFVSHNLAAVQNLCGRALLLANGRSIAIGDTDDILQSYLAEMRRDDGDPLDRRKDREGSGDVRFVSVSLEGSDGVPVTAFRCGADSKLHILLHNRSGRELHNFHLSVGVNNEMAQRIALLDSEMLDANIKILPAGLQSVRITMQRMPLMPGRYQLTLYSAVNGIVADWIKNAATMDIEAGDFFRTGRLPPAGHGMLIDHSLEYQMSDKALSREEIS
jgi:homopolymeric O-antigen transport system ATP-binding protein